MEVLDSQLSVDIWSFRSYQLKLLAISQLSVNFDRSHSQLSVKTVVISQILTVKILAISQLSVKPHQGPLKSIFTLIVN